MIEIVRGTKSGLPQLMEFINLYWKKDHILSKNIDLLLWQYGDIENSNLLNWYLAKRKDEILGILGYIPSYRFDNVLKENSIIWLALWKVRDDVKVAGLGLRLLNTVMKEHPSSPIAVSGINVAHPPIYKALGFEVGELSQYFVCNQEMFPTLITCPDKDHLPYPNLGTATSRILQRDLVLQETTKIDAIFSSTTSHVKTARYLKNRFIDHPIYKYHIVELLCEDITSAYMVIRIAEQEGNKVLRIVDYIGNISTLGECGSLIQQLLVEHECQYADMWQSGQANTALEKAGFKKVDPDGDIIVPNYFEPFLNKNGRILCALKGADLQSVLITRADGDQDRPN